MFYLLYQFREFFSPLNIFQYITFRSGGALLTALLLSLLLGDPLINYLRKRGMLQTIRSDGPPEHLKKQGTPTMGGLIILISVVAASLLWMRWDSRFVWPLLGVILSLGLLGGVDDYQKLVRKNPRGLPSAFKLGVELFLALLIVIYLIIEPPHTAYLTKIVIPYTKGIYLDLGFFYYALAMLLFIGAVNAVNLTDGLDGLAGGVLVIACLTYSLFAYLTGHLLFSIYLRIIPVADAGELTVILSGAVGALLGFLWYNSYPANIFMGDTGALFLGGLLGTVALFIKQELLLIIIGGIFVVETLSVLLQIYTFRHWKRRIFRMAPLHHHYEIGGIPESKVTVRFWIIAIVLSLLALSSLKLR